MQERVKKGVILAASGEVGQFFDDKQIVHPEFEILDEEVDTDDLTHTGRIIPAYDGGEQWDKVGLASRNIRRIIKPLIDGPVASMPDYMPEDARKSRHLMPLAQALGDDDVERLPDRLRFGKSENPFGSGVPKPDHAVPVLTVTRPGGKLEAVLFGYACHPTTLSFQTWCGDYPGFAQLELEASHPGATAMFVNTCGGDQNPLPRRSVELCQRYGQMLAAARQSAIFFLVCPDFFFMLTELTEQGAVRIELYLSRLKNHPIEIENHQADQVLASLFQEPAVRQRAVIAQ